MIEINQLLGQLDELSETAEMIALKQHGARSVTDGSHFYYEVSLVELIRAIRQAGRTENLNHVHLWRGSNEFQMSANFHSTRVHNLLTLSAEVK